MDRLIIIFLFLVASMEVFASGNNNEIYNASPAVRNTLQYGFDQVYSTEIIEQANFSDDFNLPKLRTFWNINSGEINFTLNERPGYLRLKSTKEKSIESLKIQNTISQKIQKNIIGEAVSYIDLSNLNEGSLTGLYFKEEKINYIGIRVIGGKNFLVSEVSGKESKRVEITDNALMLRVNIDNLVCWFEYSVDGFNFSELGSGFQIKQKEGTDNYVGIFCINSQQEGGVVDVDWFYFKPTTEISTQFAETGGKIINPTL